MGEKKEEKKEEKKQRGGFVYMYIYICTHTHTHRPKPMYIYKICTCIYCRQYNIRRKRRRNIRYTCIQNIRRKKVRGGVE